MNSPPIAFTGWELLFASFAVVVILLEILRGWRLGLMRQLVRVVAVIAAYAVAVYGGRVIVPWARSIYKMPDAVLAMIGGVLLAAVVYTVITSLGVILFRRTSQHTTKGVRLLWGSTGAILGILFGAIFVWLAFTGVRLIGSVASAQAHTAAALHSGTIQPVWNRPLEIEGKLRAAPPATNAALATTLAQMKDSLESGAAGAALKELDPLPPATYRTMEKLGAVATNVESAQRFLSFPGAHDISDHPKVIALRNDPEITDLVAHGRVLGLLRNQRLIDALNDPGLREQIRRFDLERALDYAIRKK